MALRTKQVVFYVIWTVLILNPLITVIRNTRLEALSTNTILLTNFFQRLFGLIAFTLIFIQIALGSFMDRLVQIIGAKAYKFHVAQGIFAYGFIFFHPLFENILIYQTSKSISQALFVFLPSFQSQREILLLFGRVAFYLATIAVIAAYFRTKPFFRKNWRAFHILNYLIFYLVFWHMRIGTDIVSPPFVWVSWIALVTVSTGVIAKFIFPIVKNIASFRNAREAQKA